MILGLNETLECCELSHSMCVQMLHGVIKSNFGILLPFKIAVIHTALEDELF